MNTTTRTVLGGASDKQDHTAPTSVKTAETAFGKDINISRCKNARMFQIDVAGGGTKPPELGGLYTSWNEAERAIRFYIDSGNGRYAEALKPSVEDSISPLADRPKLKLE